MSPIRLVEQGGTVAWILVGMNIIGIWTILWKLLTLYQFKKRERPTLSKAIINKITVSTNHTLILELIRTEIGNVFTPLERGVTTICTIASIAPLLGLLGTVMGIFTSFGSMAEAGVSDASVLAGGIKLALITTIIGLIVAIPHVISYNYFVSRIDRERDEVENEVLREFEGRVI